MSLLRSRPSPVWVIGPRSVLSPVECSMGTKPRNPPSWRIFSSSRQSPILATSWLATIQTNPGNRHHILNALGQFGVGLTKAADLFGALKDLFLGKLQTVKQLIELKAHRVRTGKLSELCLHDERPLAAGWSRGKGNPLEQQQRFNALLHPHRLTHHRIAKLSEVAKLAIYGRGNMNAFQLSSTQTFRQGFTVEPIGFHPLSWSSGDHRWSGDQARIPLSRKSIIQPVPCGSSLVGKGHLLIRKVVAYMVQQGLHFIRHAQGSDESLVSTKSCRDALFVHIQSAKHIILSGNNCLVSHLSASFGQC